MEYNRCPYCEKSEDTPELGIDTGDLSNHELRFLMDMYKGDYVCNYIFHAFSEYPIEHALLRAAEWLYHRKKELEEENIKLLKMQPIKIVIEDLK